MDELLKARRQELQQRNEFLLHGGGPVIKFSQDPIEILNNVTVYSDLDELYIKWLNGARLPDALQNLLQWAITSHRMGEHRSYLVGAILVRYAKDGRLGRRRDLQDRLQLFLDQFDSSNMQEAKQLSELYGEIIRRDLFSLDAYIQRLISRGDLEGISLYHQFPHITHLPIYKAKLSQINHRRVSLFWGSSQGDDEEQIYVDICKTIAGLFPDMCGRPDLEVLRSNNAEQEYFLSRLDSGFVTRLESLPKYLRVRVGEWLASRVFQYVVTDKV